MVGDPAKARSGALRRLAVGTAVAVAGGVGVLVPSPAGAVAPAADLSVTSSHSPSTGRSGAPLAVTITAHNDGPDTAAKVVAALSYDYPLQLSSAPAGCRLTGTPGVVCALGDLASGASAELTVSFQPRSSGLYQLPVAVSSDTADPDAADRVTTETIIVEAGPSIGERYVRGVLPIVLDHAATAQNVSYWAPRFDVAWRQGGGRVVSVPSGWIHSNEYLRLRIREAYPRILGRPANAGDLAYWTPKLAAGLDHRSFDRRLISSREFAAHWHQGASNSSEIVAIYRSVLGRSPRDGEVTVADQNALFAGRLTYAGIALRLQRSNEGLDRVIDGFYQDTLGHGPSALARYGWKLDLQKGVSPESLWAKLLVGNELLAKYPPSDDDYGYGGGPVPVFDFSG